VNAALIAHHAVVLFFYNPAGAEDRALLAELNHLSMPRGVLRASIPLSQLSQYPAITNAVQINQAATFVLVNTSGQASTIVGYTDPFELQTRIEQAAGVYGLASAFSASLKLPPPPTAAQIGQGAAGRLLAQSLSALARVRSFRMDADITGNGTHMRAIAVLGTRSTEFDITVTHGDQNLELIGLPVTSYVRANSAFWVAHGFGARVGSLSNRWIAAPTARLGKLGADVTGKGATELTRCAGQNLGTLSFAGSGSVNGQPVTVLRDAGDKPGSSPDLYEIAKRPPHLLLGIIGQGGTRPGGRISVCNDGQGGDWRGSGTFSQFGHPTPIAPPADALRPSLSIV
jgi:hypothetical protein